MIRVRSIVLALLGALLLVSQHTAVTHALWHQAHDAVHHHASTDALASDSHSHDEEAGKLCAFDAMLGQLLDGGGPAGAIDIVHAEALSRAPASDHRLVAHRSIQPRSRGPPVLL